MSENLNPSAASVPPAAQPPQRGASNGFGIASMILGILTMLGFAIPFLNYGAVATGIVGVILGIIGLVIKFKPRKAAIAGVIMSGLGLILSFILIAVYTAAFIGAVQTLTDDAGPTTSVQPSTPAEGQPEGADGSRDKPFPIGTSVENDEWAVTVNSVTFGADDAVLAASPINKAPEAGNEYVLINVTMTYLGDNADGGMPVFVGVDYVTPGGVTVDKIAKIMVAPDAIDSLSTLYKGASATGNIVLEVPSENASDGVIVIRPGMLGDKVFIAAK